MNAVSKSLVRLGDRHSPALSSGGAGSQQITSYHGLVPHPAERIDRGATWSDPEVEELLNIWTNRNVQAELKEATIKKHIFERIARSLREAGFFRTAEQCREKIKRLKKEYRQAKNNNYRCVRGRATVKFFPRLQAVLEHSMDAIRPNLKPYYDGPPDYGPADTPSPCSLVIKESPHSPSDCSAEEMKVEVNPAELSKDAYMDGGSSDLEAGIPDDDDTPPPTDLSFMMDNHRGALSLAAAPQRPQSAHHPRSHTYNHLAHPLEAVQRPISISIPHQYNHHGVFGSHDNSRRTNHTGSSHSTPSGLSLVTKKVNGASVNGTWRAKDNSDASSGGSRANSPAPTRDRSPTSSVHRKKSKRSRTFRSHELKETLDLTLDRLLSHQREAEDRLFAWEERRVQEEMEVEERWRQEDRTLLQQILVQLAGTRPTNGVSGVSPAASSRSPSNSSHEH